MPQSIFTPPQRATLADLRAQESKGLIVLGAGRIIGNTVFFAEGCCIGAILPDGRCV